LRINDTTEHPRQGKKYRVWPLLNFAVAIDDHALGLTHVLRGKDHYDNTKRQMYIYDYLGWKPPAFLHIGRINFEGLRLSASETRRAIEKKQYTGWNDIRLPFLQAMKKRGYQPEAFAKYAKSVGVTMTDKTVQGSEFFKTLDTFNREVIGQKANRYFFIENPKEIKIDKAPDQEVELHLHPEKKKGGRKFKVKDKFYLSQEDLDEIKKLKDGSLIRLMDCLNFTKKGNKFNFHSKDYEYYKVNGKKIIHWLPVQKGLVDVEVITPEEDIKIGLGEPLVKKLKKGEIIQFERFAFCKLNEIGKDKYWFWYTHK
jgi:glutamyl-tRNA synthetase